MSRSAQMTRSKSAGTPAHHGRRKTMAPEYQPQAAADEYGMAMGQPAGGHQADDERYAFGNHKEELTGDLAQARDAHARTEIDHAAAGFRQRQADREAGQ
jgi:hypothetical protein